MNLPQWISSSFGAFGVCASPQGELNKAPRGEAQKPSM